jgi:hypothetical protein
MARKGSGKKGKDAQPQPVAANEPARQKPGPAPEYTPELGILICENIAESKTLNDVAAMIGYDRRTILRWLAANQDFQKAYALAHELQGDHDADSIRDIVRRVVGTLKEGEERLSAADARVAIDALKWTAGKRKPKVYGEKLDIDTPADGNLAKAVAASAAVLAAITTVKGDGDGQ